MLVGIMTQGLIYALLSYGIFITYKILDFPDLTVDGSFPLGAAVTALLMTNGTNPILAMLISLLAGAAAGFITGFIHVKLKVRDLLAGIITMTALISINLQIAGSNLALSRDIKTIFTMDTSMALFGKCSLPVRKLIICAVIAVVVKIILDFYFRTKSGMLLRATGDNHVLVTSLAKNKGSVKILGLVIANSLVALCGSVVCQEQRAFNSTMGTGQMVFGLAAVIIGTTIFKRLSFIKGTTAVVTGSIIYKACIMIAINLGMPANLLNFITAVLFLIILVCGNISGRKGLKNA